MSFPKRDHTAHKVKDLPMRLQTLPVEPGGFVVLVKRVVVAVLWLQKFITHAKHRRSTAARAETEEILDLPSSQAEPLFRELAVPLAAA